MKSAERRISAELVKLEESDLGHLSRGGFMTKEVNTDLQHSSGSLGRHGGGAFPRRRRHHPSRGAQKGVGSDHVDGDKGK